MTNKSYSDDLKIYNIEKEYANRVKEVALSKLGYNQGVQNFAEPFSKTLINKFATTTDLLKLKSSNEPKPKEINQIDTNKPQLMDIINSYKPSYPTSLKIRYDPDENSFFWGNVPIMLIDNQIGEKLLIVSGRVFPFTPGLISILKFMKVSTTDIPTLINFITICDSIHFGTPGSKIRQTKIYKGIKNMLESHSDYVDSPSTHLDYHPSESSPKAGDGVSPRDRFLTLLAAKQEGHNNVDKELRSLATTSRKNNFCSY